MKRGVEFDLQAELEFRQDQFASLIGVNPSELRGLKFCKVCLGIDYQWEDYTTSTIELDFETAEEAFDYRTSLTDRLCRPCDGTGFAGGNFRLTPEQWLELGSSKS